MSLPWRCPEQHPRFVILSSIRKHALPHFVVTFSFAADMAVKNLTSCLIALLVITSLLQTCISEFVPERRCNKDPDCGFFDHVCSNGVCAIKKNYGETCFSNKECYSKHFWTTCVLNHCVCDEEFRFTREGCLQRSESTTAKFRPGFMPRTRGKGSYELN